MFKKDRFPKRRENLFFVGKTRRGGLRRRGHQIQLADVRKLVLLKLSDDVITPGQGIADAILLTEPQGDTATGAAVAHCVEVLPALDDSMDKASLVALA